MADIYSKLFFRPHTCVDKMMVYFPGILFSLWPPFGIAILLHRWVHTNPGENVFDSQCLIDDSYFTDCDERQAHYESGAMLSESGGGWLFRYRQVPAVWDIRYCSCDCTKSTQKPEQPYIRMYTRKFHKLFYRLITASVLTGKFSSTNPRAPHTNHPILYYRYIHIWSNTWMVLNDNDNSYRCYFVVIAAAFYLVGI